MSQKEILTHTVVGNRYGENHTRNNQGFEGLENGAFKITCRNDIHRISAYKTNVIAATRKNGIAYMNGVGFVGVGLRLAILIVIDYVFAVLILIAAICILFEKNTADCVGCLRVIKTVNRIIDAAIRQARNARVGRICPDFAIGKQITCGEAELCDQVLIQIKLRLCKFFYLKATNAITCAENGVICSLFILHCNGIHIGRKQLRENKQGRAGGIFTVLGIDYRTQGVCTRFGIDLVLISASLCNKDGIKHTVGIHQVAVFIKKLVNALVALYIIFVAVLYAINCIGIYKRVDGNELRHNHKGDNQSHRNCRQNGNGNFLALEHGAFFICHGCGLFPTCYQANILIGFDNGICTDLHVAIIPPAKGVSAAHGNWQLTNGLSANTLAAQL